MDLTSQFVKPCTRSRMNREVEAGPAPWNSGHKFHVSP